MERNEAIESLRQLYSDADAENKAALECLIPELRESEDDRIRKWLSDFLDMVNWRNDWPYTKQQVINYLEKLKEGCLVIPSGDTAPAEEDTISKNEQEFLENEIKAFLCNYDKEFDDDAPTYDIAEHFYRLGKKALEKQKEQKPLSTEETELNSIAFLEQMGYTCIPPKEQKPAEDWREERKKECPYRGKLDNNLYGCKRYADVVCACTGNCSWVVDYPKLKEFQDRKEQQPAEWSEEDENALIYLHQLISFGFIKKFFDAQTAADMRDWVNRKLKSFRPQPKQEWCEEDEDKVDDICKLIEHATIIPRCGDDDTGIPPTRLNDKYKGELKAFVESFRNRPTKSGNWKPSKEQMEALERAIVKMHTTNDIGILAELRDNLKKL